FSQGSDWVQSSASIFAFTPVVMMRSRRQALIPEPTAVTALTHAEQTAVPARGGIEPRAAVLRRRSIDPDKPLLETAGLEKSFGGIHAVRDLNLTVMAGSIVGIIGPNGSGKTTLFNLVTGLAQPSAGSVRLAGEEITGL